MKPFNELQILVIAQCFNRYQYNIGDGYIGITFSSYDAFWSFKKSELYKWLKPYKVLTRYTKYLYYKN